MEKTEVASQKSWLAAKLIDAVVNISEILETQLHR